MSTLALTSVAVIGVYLGIELLSLVLAILLAILVAVGVGFGRAWARSVVDMRDVMGTAPSHEVAELIRLVGTPFAVWSLALVIACCDSLLAAVTPKSLRRRIDSASNAVVGAVTERLCYRIGWNAALFRVWCLTHRDWWRERPTREAILDSRERVLQRDREDAAIDQARQRAIVFGSPDSSSHLN